MVVVNSLGRAFVLSIALALLPVIAVHALEVYPGASQVDSSAQSEAGIHQLVTGKVKRISGNVQPESVDFVQGVKTTRTFSLDPSVGRDALVEFYREQLTIEGQILFECEGRGCGTSSYWSNQVFGRSQLYGPQEYQHYFLARIGLEQRQYVTVYLAQRATGTRFLHIETISDVSSEPLADSRLMLSALRLQNRYVIDFNPDAQALALLGEVMSNAQNDRVALVVHASVLPGESFDAGVARTQSHADGLVAKLEEMGVDTRNIQAFGAGASMPLDKTDRVELVEILEAQ